MRWCPAPVFTCCCPLSEMLQLLLLDKLASKLSHSNT